MKLLLWHAYSEPFDWRSLPVSHRPTCSTQKHKTVSLMPSKDLIFTQRKPKQPSKWSTSPPLYWISITVGLDSGIPDISTVTS